MSLACLFQASPAAATSRFLNWIRMKASILNYILKKVCLNRTTESKVPFSTIYHFIIKNPSIRSPCPSLKVTSLKNISMWIYNISGVGVACNCVAASGTHDPIDKHMIWALYTKKARVYIRFWHCILIFDDNHCTIYEYVTSNIISSSHMNYTCQNK